MSQNESSLDGASEQTRGVLINGSLSLDNYQVKAKNLFFRHLRFISLDLNNSQSRQYSLHLPFFAPYRQGNGQPHLLHFRGPICRLLLVPDSFFAKAAHIVEVLLPFQDPTEHCDRCARLIHYQSCPGCLEKL